MSKEPNNPSTMTMDDYMTMTAAMIGKVNALEMIVGALLEQRTDLDALERRVDRLLLQREADVLTYSGDQGYTMHVHEMSRQNVAAAFINARARYGL